MPLSAPSEPVILIVDDEIDITETYSMLFELHHFRVLTANSGAEALQKFKDHAPDIVLSDCMMPGMDGIALCRQIRALETGRNVPIILNSAAPQFHNLSGSEHDLFLQKPIKFERLLAEIRRLMAKKNKK